MKIVTSREWLTNTNRKGNDERKGNKGPCTNGASLSKLTECNLKSLS